MRRLAVLLALVLSAALAACGGGGGGGATETAASSKPCPAGAVKIQMKDIKFAPEKAGAKVGQSVCWTNDDDVQHDAVDEDGHAFHSALFGQGKTFTWKADTAGTVKYVCTVHPGMDGELDVTG
jgi:plastocyanin